MELSHLPRRVGRLCTPRTFLKHAIERVHLTSCSKKGAVLTPAPAPIGAGRSRVDKDVFVYSVIDACASPALTPGVYYQHHLALCEPLQCNTIQPHIDLCVHLSVAIAVKLRRG
jgi:hypothetical protein